MVQVEQSADFGIRMRLVRESRGITLRDIATTTNLSVAQLEALERNDIARLPGGIFLRGIIRSYAQQIGLDPESTLLEFISSQPSDSGVIGTPQVYQSDYERSNASRPRGFVSMSVLALVAIVVAGIVWVLVR
jgi:cytoskeletal protein RodZ